MGIERGIDKDGAARKDGHATRRRVVVRIPTECEGGDECKEVDGTVAYCTLVNNAGQATEERTCVSYEPRVESGRLHNKVDPGDRIDKEN